MPLFNKGSESFNNTYSAYTAIFTREEELQFVFLSVLQICIPIDLLFYSLVNLKKNE